MVAVAVVLVFAVLQWRGVIWGSTSQNITSLLKAIAFVVLIAAAFMLGGNASAATYNFTGDTSGTGADCRAGPGTSIRDLHLRRLEWRRLFFRRGNQSRARHSASDVWRRSFGYRDLFARQSGIALRTRNFGDCGPETMQPAPRPRKSLVLVETLSSGRWQFFQC